MKKRTGGLRPPLASAALLLRRLIRRRATTPLRHSERRRFARRAVNAGAFLFAIATLSLMTATETVKPEWRDPEYGRRLQQMQQWQRERPDRPLVVVVGSSRVQQGLSPAAMAFPDEAGSPLVYNLGIRGATPVGVWLQLARMLDDGIRPHAVVVMIAGIEIRTEEPPEKQFRKWAARFSFGDLRRLELFAEDAAELRREVMATRLRPWTTQSALLIDDLCPLWELPANTFHHTAWSRMDRYGFSPYPVEFNRPGVREHALSVFKASQQSALNSTPPGNVSVRAIHTLIARCQAEGIAVAACWAPESPAYRALYTERGFAIDDAFAQSLSAKFGVPVFPGPTHLNEDDFVDCIHLFPDAAAKYSAWLADNHLKPWLANALK